MLSNPETVDVANDPLYATVWGRPGLNRRDRRFVALTCVCATGNADRVDDHMYSALASGDIDYDELLEFVLHFAVYCGWPRGSQAEASARSQYARWCAERGVAVPDRPDLPLDSLPTGDGAQRLAIGERCFADVNLLPAPTRDSPYFQAGIIAYVFGHVWLRPGLGRRERRLITVACVGVAEVPWPIYSHVGSALESGDLTYEEMDEVILQFGAYTDFVRAGALRRVADETRQRISTDPEGR